MARASVWLYSSDGAAIEVVATHPAGVGARLSLRRESAPAYFRALEQDLVIAAEDALSDARTLELSPTYLRPNGVGALLDAPIRLGGRSVGVLCLEHRGGRRSWTLEEQNFAAALAEMVALALDQHQRRRVEEALFREKERAQVTLESIADGVVTTDVTGRINYINPVAAELTGWAQAQAHGHALQDVVHLFDEATGAPLEDVYGQVVGGDGHVCLPQDLRLVHRDGRRDFSIEVSAAPLRDREQRLIGAVLVFHDVTELRGMARLMSYQASHDVLTGLPNRREFEAQVEQALRAAAQEGSRHVLMYLDLDQFKVVNDTCGHVAGDELLKQVGSLLQGSIGQTDLLARLGGDEFGVLLNNRELSAARAVAETMKQVIKEFRFAWESRMFDLSVSIGVVAVDRHSRDLGELLSAADAACYVAKDEGRNRVHVYLPDDAVTARRHGEMQWVHRINRAFAENRLHLYYQPIVPLGTGGAEKVSCEVLIRMVDEAGELVPPMAFIPAAERYQMMTGLDQWVVHEVLAALGRGDSALEAFELCSINLSGQSLCDDQFLGHVLGAIVDNDVDPRRLCFEITETAAIANFPRATRLIAELRARGCRFALDDFGSGLSSFAYLKTLAVDFLKIDGEFVRDMAHDPVDYAMVAAINHLGHVMGKKTIAEHVEDQAVVEHLRRLGVDYAQGYAIARPAPLRPVPHGALVN